MTKYNNSDFNNFNRVNFNNLKLTAKSKIKILNGVNFNHIKFNSSSKLNSNLDVRLISLPKYIERKSLAKTFNDSEFSSKTINKTINIKFYSNHKVIFLNNTDYINLDLNSNSRLFGDLTTEKFNLPNTDRSNLKNAYNDSNYNYIALRKLNLKSKITSKSLIKILNGVYFNNLILNSNSKLFSNLIVEKANLPNTDRLNLKNAYNDSIYNLIVLRKIILKAKLDSKSLVKILNGVYFINIKLNSKSKLFSNLTNEKANLPNINRTNFYNDLDFNKFNRNHYTNIKFNSTSILDDQRDNRSINFFDTSKMVAVAKKINVITPINADHVYFGGKYNNTNFNRANRDQYISITIKSISKFSHVENNIEATIKGSSFFNLDGKKKSGFINTIKFNDSTKLDLNLNLHASPNYNIKSSSNLKINPNKYMWSSVNYLSQSFLILRNFRATFLDINFLSRSILKLNAFIISEEVLTLENLNFKPNDVITIDLNDYYVLHNGHDITYKMKGAFFKFYPKENMLIWHDDVNERNIKLEILYQNKFL